MFIRAGFFNLSRATLHYLAAHLPGLQSLAGNITAGRTIRPALNIFKLSHYHTPKRSIWQRWRYTNRGMIRGSRAVVKPNSLVTIQLRLFIHTTGGLEGAQQPRIGVNNQPCDYSYTQRVVWRAAGPPRSLIFSRWCWRLHRQHQREGDYSGAASPLPNPHRARRVIYRKTPP
jgi:hypothetical protein